MFPKEALHEATVEEPPDSLEASPRKEHRQDDLPRVQDIDLRPRGLTVGTADGGHTATASGSTTTGSNADGRGLRAGGVTLPPLSHLTATLFPRGQAPSSYPGPSPKSASSAVFEAGPSGLPGRISPEVSAYHRHLAQLLDQVRKENEYDSSGSPVPSSPVTADLLSLSTEDLRRMLTDELHLYGRRRPSEAVSIAREAQIDLGPAQMGWDPRQSPSGARMHPPSSPSTHKHAGAASKDFSHGAHGSDARQMADGDSSVDPALPARPAKHSTSKASVSRPKEYGAHSLIPIS